MSKKQKALGIDTSNYTCSACVLDSYSGEVYQAKLPIPVKRGKRGVRQSDAVFHHTMLLPRVMEQLGDICHDVSVIGVSDRPSCRENSYMPCFMVGLSTAKSLSIVNDIPYFATTHQTGHILAAMYSCKKLGWLSDNKRFLAFHVSGGTTDMLLCDCGGENVIDIRRIGGSMDLKAGQAIDRCGVMLGLDFPCGAQLERLANRCDEKIKIKPSVKELDCSLSGIENKCRQLFKSGTDKEYIATYCIKSVEAAICVLTQNAIDKYGSLPIIYAGGVMSNKIIAKSISERFDAHFASPEFSCDNAVGTAVYAAFKKGLI